MTAVPALLTRRRVATQVAALAIWPEAAVPECLFSRRCQGISGHSANGPKMTRVTHSGIGDPSASTPARVLT
jgi:hypothetical protein